MSPRLSGSPTRRFQRLAPPNWGLGVAGLFHFASMKVKGIDSRMSAEGISLLFSATYN
jgi:hypothetical protein